MQKTQFNARKSLENFFRASRRESFFSVMEGVPPDSFSVFVDDVTIFNSSPM